MTQQLDFDELALRIHGTYISEPSSDYDSSHDGKSDFDDDYRSNEPFPELLEMKPIVTCEPFQLVKHKKKRKPKVTRKPTLLVSSVPKVVKKCSYKNKSRRRVRISKTNSKAVITEIPSSSAQVNKESRATVVCNNTNVPVKVIAENHENTTNNVKNNTNIIRGTFKDAISSEPKQNPFINKTSENLAGSPRTFENVLDFLNHQNYAWLNDRSQQTIGNDMLPNYYAPEDSRSIKKHNTSGKTSKKNKTVSSTSESMHTSINVGHYAKTEDKVKKQNQVKPATVSNPFIQAITRRRNRNTNNKHQQEKELAQKCQNRVSESNKQLSSVTSNQEFGKSSNIAQAKNVPRIKSSNGSTPEIRKLDIQKGNKSVMTPQQSNKKESANHIHKNIMAQQSRVSLGLQYQQPPANNELTGNSKSSKAKLRRHRRRHKVKNMAPAEEEVQLAFGNLNLQCPVKHLKAQNLQSTNPQTKVTGFSNQLPTPKGNIGKSSFNNQNNKGHSQNASKTQNLNINKMPNFQPLMKVHSELSNLRYNAAPQTNCTNSTPNIPSLMEIDPFYGTYVPKKPKKNKKKKGGRCSIGVQVGCSFRQLQSVEIQTHNLWEMQNYLANVPPTLERSDNLNRFFY